MKKKKSKKNQPAAGVKPLSAAAAEAYAGTEDETSRTDILGSYTGRAGDDRPVQDADDL